MLKYFYKKNKGFTLLMAIVTTSMLLVVSFFVVNVALKQLVISISNKESQYAFYNSESGLECATYWDLLETGSAFDAYNTFPKTISFTFTSSRMSAW